MLEDVLVRFGQYFGKPRGWERVIRWLSPPGKLRGSELIIRQFPEGYSFYIDPGTLIGWYLYFFWTYEPEVRRVIKQVVTPGSVAIDVGANVGWHTMFLSLLVGEKGRVFAFEPNPSTRERLVLGLKLNQFVNVQVMEVALSEQVGEVLFNAPEAGDYWDGTGRIETDLLLATRSVESTTLDHLLCTNQLPNIDFMKVDVEGWEMSVLRGGRVTIERCRPYVIFEYDPSYVRRSGTSSAEIFSFFQERSYCLYGINRSGLILVYEPQSRFYNYLAVPSDRAQSLISLL
jgi:FkbM family methyltransferase